MPHKCAGIALLVVAAAAFAFTVAGCRTIGGPSSNLGAWPIPTEAREVANPVAATGESVARGGKLFDDHCVKCHGAQGRGNGPAALFIKPRPADVASPELLTTATDGALFYRISHGRGPMPAFKDELTEDQRWDLVNYIRELERRAQQGA